MLQLVAGKALAACAHEHAGAQAARHAGIQIRTVHRSPPREAQDREPHEAVRHRVHVHREGEPSPLALHRSVAEEHAVGGQFLRLPPHGPQAPLEEQAVVLQPVLVEGERRRKSALELHAGGRLTEPQAPEHVRADLLENGPGRLHNLHHLGLPQPDKEPVAEMQVHTQDVGMGCHHDEPEHEEVHEGGTVLLAIRLQQGDLRYVRQPVDRAHAEVVTDVLPRRSRDGHIRHAFKQQSAVAAEDVVPRVTRELLEALGRPDDRCVVDQRVYEERRLLHAVQEMSDLLVPVLDHLWYGIGV
mmetsp:Transcript_61754/g.181076  ORF Transcript_61754/g.181076 Transcript_61754/m.181076 type:complete len:300 (+) Transcript_61754:1201-2100(+)